MSLEAVESNFRHFDLLEGVKFVKGWFRDSLPASEIKKIAVLRLDGDLYESTMESLSALYEKVSAGGFIIVDDYGNWPPCRKAVRNFLSKRGLNPEIIDIDGSGAYWRRVQSPQVLVSPDSGSPARPR